VKDATRCLLAAFSLYGNYRVDSRGPMGLLQDAIDDIDPAIGAEIRASGEDIATISREIIDREVAEKRMPIQRCGFSLPEALGREVYEAYARKHGRDQSYEHMIKRGGFGLFECVWILHGIWPATNPKDFERHLERFLARALAK
jgi:hypothetical protein